MLPGHYTPTAAAAMIGISVSSLRNYCSQFKELLSADASPPAGVERRLTPADVATLQRVKELRGQGMAPADIVATLQSRLQTEDTATLQPYIDSTTTDLKPAQAQPTAQELAPATTQAIELYSAILSHTTALQSRMDAMQAQIDSQARAGASRFTLFVAGILIGLVVALIIVGVLWLGR